MNSNDPKYKMMRIGLFTILTINIMVALFGALSAATVSATDEACYGINAYEMLKSGNIWVNTLKYNLDYYNSKPPLMLWLIMIGYKIFGCNTIGLRITSAVCGLILYFIVCFFIYKKQNSSSVLIFASFLPACTLLFDYHMMRSGDTDSLYVLCFTVAMIGLIMAYNNPSWLVLYGLAFGLAFMAKSTHAALILIIGILCFPFLIKSGTKIKNIVISALTAIIVILPWAIQRIRYDSLQFFKVMIFGETIGYATGNAEKEFKEFFAYVVQLKKEPICVISFIIIAIAICIKYLKWVKENDSAKLLLFINNVFTYRRYVLLMWFIVVFGAFSLVKSGIEWYIYPAYIPLIMMAAERGSYIVRTFYDRGKKISSAVLFLIIILSAFYISVNNTSEYPWNVNGGNAIVNFESDLETLRDNEEIETSGRNAYIECCFNEYKTQRGWELHGVFYAETIADVYCIEGGVPEFISTDDMDAILFIDKSLWDQYSDALNGYVILQDNNYLIISKHKYGE